MRYFSMFSGIGGLTLERLGMCVLSNPHGFNKGLIKEKPTIRACNNYVGNEPLVKDGRIRRLTPTECERLQGFPDGWTEGISDTQRYKCLGNAVTVNVIEALAEKLLNYGANRQNQVNFAFNPVRG